MRSLHSNKSRIHEVRSLQAIGFVNNFAEPCGQKVAFYGFLEWGYPRIIQYFSNKPCIFGVLHFGKPPYGGCLKMGTPKITSFDHLKQTIWGWCQGGSPHKPSYWFVQWCTPMFTPAADWSGFPMKLTALGGPPWRAGHRHTRRHRVASLLAHLVLAVPWLCYSWGTAEWGTVSQAISVDL